MRIDSLSSSSLIIFHFSFPFPQNKLKEDKEKTSESRELVSIPEGFHGFVIGRRGNTLKEISSRTGAHLFVEERNVYLSGSQEARKMAKLEIGLLVVSN